MTGAAPVADLPRQALTPPAPGLARILSSALGREVRAEQAPLAAVVPAFRGFGMSEGPARLSEEMFAAINEGRAAFEGKGAEFRRGSIGAAEVFRGILGI